MRRAWRVWGGLMLLALWLAGPAAGEGASVPGAVSSERTVSCDVIVVGGGLGGCAASIQAARMGMRVVLVEETDRVGGQAVAAAVSTLDDVRRTRTGLYRELIERIRSRYGAIGRPTNTCYWGSDTIAAEPEVLRELLMSMLREAGEGASRGGGVTLLLRSRAREAILRGNALSGVRVDSPEGPLTLLAPVTIEATECGDLLPLTPARYRAGNSIFPGGNPDGEIQDITYVAVIRRFPAGRMPADLRMKNPPPGYGEALPGFRRVIARDGSGWPGKAPYDVVVHDAYRGLPDSQWPEPLPVDGGDPATWPNLTKTSINWANDWPGRGGGAEGLKARYLEDRAFRREQDRKALRKTLQFLYYLQTELGRGDWSVAPEEGYDAGFGAGDLESWRDDARLASGLPDEYETILRLFPPRPYVREGRRILGVRTLTRDDLERDERTGRAFRRFETSLALGEYPVDIHGSHLDRFLEHDLGERESNFPKGWEPSKGVFQIPLEVFLPERLDGLIAAEKNLSVSRMANGAIRLQPAVLLTGQAAGALAAEAVRRRVPPRDVPPLAVQAELLSRGDRLALEAYSDVPEGTPLWAAVQLVSLYDLMPGLTLDRFGPDLPLSGREASAIRDRWASRLASAAGTPKGDEAGEGGGGARTAFLSRADWVERIRPLLGGRGFPPGSAAESARSDETTATRGFAAVILAEALCAEAGVAPPGRPDDR